MAMPTSSGEFSIAKINRADKPGDQRSSSSQKEKYLPVERERAEFLEELKPLFVSCRI